MNKLVPVLLLLFAFFPVKADEIKELKQLIISLNSHVVNLEKRVKELEKLVKVKRTGVSYTKATWRKLKRGMSPSAVRDLLSEPQDIDAGFISYWYYTNSHYSSKLQFSNDKLSSWVEPSK